MRKIILGIDITVDGVIEAPETWRFGYLSPDLSVYDMSKVNSLDSLLLGRKTYEGFSAFWPTQIHNEYGIASKLNSAPKYVVSSTLKRADWNNSKIISQNVEEEITELKSSPGGDIGITGSITLVQWLMQRGLIDEYDLLTFPIVLGRGRRLFGEGARATLQLIESKAFNTGAVLSRYQAVKGETGQKGGKQQS